MDPTFELNLLIVKVFLIIFKYKVDVFYAFVRKVFGFESLIDYPSIKLP